MFVFFKVYVLKVYEYEFMKYDFVFWFININIRKLNSLFYSLYL